MNLQEWKEEHDYKLDLIDAAVNHMHNALATLRRLDVSDDAEAYNDALCDLDDGFDDIEDQNTRAMYTDFPGEDE